MVIRYMLRFFMIIGFCLTVGTGIAAMPNPWYLLTVQDLTAMHQIIARDDPATVGLATSGFKQWYNPGFIKAMTKAKQVDSYAGYQAVLTYYVNGFNSEHLNISFSSLREQVEWPGFIVAMRGNKYQVVYRENSRADVPALGAQLLSCDRQSPDALMQKNIVPYTDNAYEKFKSTWTQHVPYLFYDNGNPWYVRPQNCVFRQNGIIRNYALHWQSTKSNTNKTHVIPMQLAFGPAPTAGIHDFGDNGVWISIPTFMPGEFTTDKKIQKSLMNVADQISQFRNKSIIVFDLRGNSGGNADYSRAILRNLYGNAYIASLGARHIWNKPWLLAYRVSPDNIHFFQQVHDFSTANAMIAASNEGKRVIYITLPLMPVLTQKIKPIKSPVTARVLLLTDGFCGSDCWLFTREMLQIPNTVQIGQPTHFMTPYTEPNPINLPSHNAVFDVPAQIFLSPLNNFDHPFVPKCTYSGYMGDTAGLQKWVLQITANPQASGLCER